MSMGHMSEYERARASADIWRTLDLVHQECVQLKKEYEKLAEQMPEVNPFDRRRG